MIEVARKHGAQIALPVRIEIALIPVRLFRQFPGIGELVDHQNAFLVTCIEKRGRRGIVTGADGVEPTGFHQSHPTPLRIGKRGSPQQAVVVVQTGSEKLDGFPVQQ